MRIKKLFSSLTRRQAMKIVSFLVIVWLFFIVPTFAQTDTTNIELNKITAFLQNVIAICSRWWVILAVLAGKLMTNDFVYGAFIHMDIYLWKIWNIIKNFANFALIALVIGSIIKNLIGKEAIDVKKIITNTLLAGILIQASWFMMWALIDLSTVATVAISGFPSSFIQSNTNIKETMNTNAKTFNTHRLVYTMDSTNPKDSIQSIPIDVSESSDSQEDLWKSFLPTSNSISGPFVYMGMGIFNFQDIMTIGTDKNAVTMSLTFALRFIFIFFFTIALLLLFIANIMRIGLLRVFIIGSPFLILILLFKIKVGSGIGKLFSLPNLMTLVFKPVIFVAGMSIMLIVVMSMNSVLIDSGAQLTNINGISFGGSTWSSTMSLEGISNVEIKQDDLFGKKVLKDGQNAFAMLLVMFLSTFLMWRIVKLSLTLGSWPIEKAMETLTWQAERMAKSMPILPFKWWAASFNAVRWFSDQNITKIARDGFGMSRQGKFDEAEANFQKIIDDKMRIQSSWSNRDYSTLDTAIKENWGKNFFTKSQAIGHDKLWWLSLSNTRWKSQLEAYLTKYPTKTFNKSDSNATWFDAYFKDGNQAANNRKILHTLMWGDTHTKNKIGTGAISYDQLLKNVYSKKPTK